MDKKLYSNILSFLANHLKVKKEVDLELLNTLLAQLAQERHNQEEIEKLGPAIVEKVEAYLNKNSFLRKFLKQRTLEIEKETKFYPVISDNPSFSISTDGVTPIAHIKQREVYLREISTQVNLIFKNEEIGCLDIEGVADLIEKCAEGFCQKENLMLSILVEESGKSQESVTFRKLEETLLLGLTKGKPGKLFIPHLLWNDIVGSSELTRLFSPVINPLEALSGFMGHFLLGEVEVEVHMDGFLNQGLRTLEGNTIVFFGNGCGENLIRKSLISELMNLNLVGKPSRGWMLYEIHVPYLLSNRVQVAKKQV